MPYFIVNGVLVHVSDSIRTGFYIVRGGKIVPVDMYGNLI